MPDSMFSKLIEKYPNSLPALISDIMQGDTEKQAHLFDVVSSMTPFGVLPLESRSPELISLMKRKLGNIFKIPVTRYQQEPELEKALTARGGRFWSGPAGDVYYKQGTGHAEGGSEIFKKFISPKNPLIIRNVGFSSLIDAAFKLNPELAYKIYLDNIDVEAMKGIPYVPNNMIRMILNHYAPRKSTLLTERLGAELAKRAGYDSVIGLTPDGYVEEVVELLK